MLGNSRFHGDKQSGRPLVLTCVVLTVLTTLPRHLQPSILPQRCQVYPWLALSPCAHLWSPGGQGLGVVHPCAREPGSELGLARLPLPGGPCRFLTCPPLLWIGGALGANRQRRPRICTVVWLGEEASASGWVPPCPLPPAVGISPWYPQWGHPHLELEHLRGAPLRRPPRRRLISTA